MTKKNGKGLVILDQDRFSMAQGHFALHRRTNVNFFQAAHCSNSISTPTLIKAPRIGRLCEWVGQLRRFDGSEAHASSLGCYGD